MKQTKEFKLVLLPSSKNERQIGSIIKHATDNILAIVNVLTIKDPQITQVQHLYAISDETIQIGDYGFSVRYGYDNPVIFGSVENSYPEEFKKIIATTNPDLWLRDNIRWLPQFPESFVTAYIKAFNEGKKIESVCLEMAHLPELSNHPYTIKVREDNTVICSQSKLYTREEVQVLCSRAYSDGYTESIQKKDMRMDNWIKKNL